MTEGLQIYGGFNGTESFRAQRNWTNNPTLLTAIAGTSAIENSDGSGRPIDRSSVLDGFVCHQHRLSNRHLQSSSQPDHPQLHLPG